MTIVPVLFHIQTVQSRRSVDQMMHLWLDQDAFVARPRSHVGSYYTSVLQVTAHPSLNGTSVRCYVPDGQGGERTVGRGSWK